MIDPYAKVNERIRQKQRAKGSGKGEYDALIRAASHELGAATEAVLGVFIDVAERIGLRYLEDAAREGATGNFRWAPDTVKAARYASSRLPGASGRAVSQSSEWVVRAGFSMLRDLRLRLDRTRRESAARAEHPRPSARAQARPAGSSTTSKASGKGGKAGGRRRSPRQRGGEGPA